MTDLPALELERRFGAARARLQTVATTGTNGKTTTTSMVAAIVAAAREPAARLTTVGAWVSGELVPAPTPTLEFLNTVERAVAAGVRTLALEVTSKALGDGLARRWPPDVAVFTNLTRDHLDMHGSPEAYLAAKAQLFLALAPGKTAVLNGDDPSSELLREVIAPAVTVETFSVRDPAASLAAREVIVRPGATTVVLAASAFAAQLGGALELAVSGGVHAQNALGAALAARAAGYGAEAIRAGLAAFRGVAGRFEVVGDEPLVVVDYAHTPDGLVGTLGTARELCRGKLICVFGCGGDRDRGKRPEMGAIVDQRADVAILTNDNPRFEDPAAIAAAVRAGAAPRARWIVELDRARAIELAIAEARPGDVVVIAGKGHEQVQEIRGVELPFSDVDVARAAIARGSS